MSYKITIEKTENITKKVGNKWEIVDYEITALQDGASQKPIMGYTPLIEKEVEVITTILEATVEQLNLTQLIHVIFAPE